jgi:hypothetical protein
MHILVTADTLGGVWTYTRELVTGLVRRGEQVTLVSFGDIPTAEQTRWMEDLPNLDYRPTAFKLEWMLDSEADMEASSQYLEAVVRETNPDILHCPPQDSAGDRVAALVSPVGCARAARSHDRCRAVTLDARAS